MPCGFFSQNSRATGSSTIVALRSRFATLLPFFKFGSMSPMLNSWTPLSPGDHSPRSTKTPETPELSSLLQRLSFERPTVQLFSELYTRVLTRASTRSYLKSGSSGKRVNGKR